MGNGKTIFVSVAASVVVCGIAASLGIQKIKSDANARDAEANARIEQLSATLADMNAPEGCKRKDLSVDLLNGTFGPSTNVTAELINKGLPCPRDEIKYGKREDKEKPQKVLAKGSYYRDMDVEFYGDIPAIRLGKNFSGDIVGANNNGGKLSARKLDDLQPVVEKMGYREKLEVKATDAHPFITKLYRVNYGCVILTVDRNKAVQQLAMTNRECGIDTDRGTFTDGNGFHGENRFVVIKDESQGGK